RKIRALAALYLAQCWRNQIFVLPALVGLFLAVLPHLITAFNISAFDRVARDVCMTLMNVLMIGLALVLGGTAVPTEIDKRSLYPILSRPLSRFQFLAGKMVGIAVALGASLLFCGLCTFLGVTTLTGHAQWPIFMGTACYWLEGCVLAASCLLISTVATAPLAISGGLLVYFLGGLSQAYVQVFLANTNRFYFQYWLVVAFKAIVPHFDVFHVKDAIVHGEEIDGQYLASLTLYGVMWILLQLSAADWVFARRDV
ncbi:MAG TPA: ABC transporter permease, partial [Candidatus Xenobia bacterium]